MFAASAKILLSAPSIFHWLKKTLEIGPFLLYLVVIVFLGEIKPKKKKKYLGGEKSFQIYDPSLINF